MVENSFKVKVQVDERSAHFELRHACEIFSIMTVGMLQKMNT